MFSAGHGQAIAAARPVILFGMLGVNYETATHGAHDDV